MNAVVFCGGRGASSVLRALVDAGASVTAIVNAYDDGKSTGEIRRFFGMLGPSDLRKVQETLLPAASDARDLFSFRFGSGTSHEAALRALSHIDSGGAASWTPIVQRYLDAFLAALPLHEAARGARFSFDDCSLMNCVVAGAFLLETRDFSAAVAAVGRLFRVRGTVIVNSAEPRWLAAERVNGELLTSEAAIVEARSSVRIRRLFLLEERVDEVALGRLPPPDRSRYLAGLHAPVTASREALLAVERADLLVYASGTQHSSLLPTYLSRGLSDAIVSNRRATKVFLTNIGFDAEVPSYRATDFLSGAVRHLQIGAGWAIPAKDLVTAAFINHPRHGDPAVYVEDDAERWDFPGVERIPGGWEGERGRHDGPSTVAKMLELLDRRWAR